jgi:acetyl-CoA C-acetyltransferase
MGNCAEKCARDFKFERTAVDEYAVESYNRALNAQKEGRFDSQIVEVVIKSRKGELVVAEDEEPGNVRFDKIPNLSPAFEAEGIITAANASKINDGAAALLVTSEKFAQANGLKPLVEIVAHSSAAKASIDFTTAPADAINKVLAKANLKTSDIDLFEINEAFAVVNMAVNKILNLEMDNVNINGGAVALGHPIGASGARILVTLIHAMKKQNAEIGLASLCIGGGEASAVIVKNYK